MDGSVSGQNASCSLASGVCIFTIVNNSTTPLNPVGCQMLVVVAANVTSITTLTANSELATTTITFANGSRSTEVSTPTNSIAANSTVTETFTVVNNINGTLSGPATTSIPASSQVTMTCTIPPAQLTQQPTGSRADGTVWMKTAGSSEATPAGTQIPVGFEGVWSLADTVLATATVTETLTTLASQATTTYAIPTTDCTYMPVTTTETTTITVGPTPPASTTTTTVTSTSTSYTQTVTVTSCTFSALPIVTSTVTTTENP